MEGPTSWEYLRLAVALFLKAIRVDLACVVVSMVVVRDASRVVVASLETRNPLHIENRFYDVSCEVGIFMCSTHARSNIIQKQEKKCHQNHINHSLCNYTQTKDISVWNVFLDVKISRQNCSLLQETWKQLRSVAILSFPSFHNDQWTLCAYCSWNVLLSSSNVNWKPWKGTRVVNCQTKNGNCQFPTTFALT